MLKSIFQTKPVGRVFDYLYCEPSPVGNDPLRVLECAAGLRPIDDLDCRISVATNASLEMLVDG
jgi:hypothetical protein